MAQTWQNNGTSFRFKKVIMVIGNESIKKLHETFFIHLTASNLKDLNKVLKFRMHKTIYKIGGEFNDY